MATFKDHFSGHAGAYAAARPSYPEELFAALAELAPTQRLAWDCGCGSGQAALGLARHFASVVATDASAAQLAHAVPGPHIVYAAALAEAPALATGAVDLVTAAQALHWFDLGRFWPEVRRVLRPGGVVAAWCYQLPKITPAVDREVARFYSEVVGPYWPPERRLVEDGYRSLPFPFTEQRLPSFAITRRWRLDGLMSYLETWSACRRCRAATGRDPVTVVADELAAAWGEPTRPRTVRWPLVLRVGRADA